MRIARKPPLSQEAIERAVAAFKAALRARSQNMSAVREAIVRAALSYSGHFTVDDLVRVLRADGVAEAHMATVYRALPLLLETRIIQPALVAKHDRQIYEAAFEREHHDHLVCSSCGTIIEFQSEAMEALQREIAERYGFELGDHIMELSGLCAVCRASPRASARRA